jgi:hypothetical protein
VRGAVRPAVDFSMRRLATSRGDRTMSSKTTPHQAQQIAKEIEDGHITATSARVVTGTLTDGTTFVRNFGNEDVMNQWLATQAIGEVSSVR